MPTEPLVVPNAVQMTLHWQLVNDSAYNVLGLVVSSGCVVDLDLANFCFDAVSTALTSSGWKTELSSTTQLVDVAVRDVRTAHLAAIVSTRSPLVGTGTSSPMVPADCAVVTLRTAFAGKSYRGRVYLSGMNSGTLSGPRLDAGGYAKAVAFLNALNTGIGAHSEMTSLGVISRELSHISNVTTCVGRSTIPGNQRRRDRRP